MARAPQFNDSKQLNNKIASQQKVEKELRREIAVLKAAAKAKKPERPFITQAEKDLVAAGLERLYDEVENPAVRGKIEKIYYKLTGQGIHDGVDLDAIQKELDDNPEFDMIEYLRNLEKYKPRRIGGGIYQWTSDHYGYNNYQNGAIQTYTFTSNTTLT